MGRWGADAISNQRPRSPPTARAAPQRPARCAGLWRERGKGGESLVAPASGGGGGGGGGEGSDDAAGALALTSAKRARPCGVSTPLRPQRCSRYAHAYVSDTRSNRRPAPAGCQAGRRAHEPRYAQTGIRGFCGQWRSTISSIPGLSACASFANAMLPTARRRRRRRVAWVAGRRSWCVRLECSGISGGGRRRRTQPAKVADGRSTARAIVAGLVVLLAVARLTEVEGRAHARDRVAEERGEAHSRAGSAKWCLVGVEPDAFLLTVARAVAEACRIARLEA